MKNAEVEWGRNDAPKPLKPLLGIESLGGDDTWNLLIISSQIAGYDVHVHGKKTHPHRNPKDQCPNCKSAMPFKWLGYVHVLDVQKDRQFFLELTQTAAERLKKTLRDLDSLRGGSVCATREARTNRKPIQFGRLNIVRGEASLPAEKFPLETLLRLWGVER